MSSPVHVLGIRHHGPGSARSVRAALSRLAPDVVLIEGPPDAAEVLGLAAHEAMKPPVALLVYASDDPARAVFYPLATFSPEWQAMSFALEKGVPVRFIDLPALHELAKKIKGPANAEAAPGGEGEGGAPGEAAGDEEERDPVIDDPIGVLAHAAGYEDREGWWEHVIEQRRELDPALAVAPGQADPRPQTPEGVFEAVLEAMRALREDRPVRSAREAQREAHMRRCIRTAQKEGFSNIAVVCGAWHAPALVAAPGGTLPSAKEDDAVLKGLAKVKVTATWIPWTMDRLAYRSGYGAGVESPGWYAHLWESHGGAAVRWMAKIAALLRGEGLDASSASVIEAVRLADALAALRERSVPGLGEMREAARAVLCSGDAAPLALIHKRLEVGVELGSVPEEAPAVPLARDLAAQQKALRLPVLAEARVLDLDLRKDNDRAKSRLFHRLLALEIGWAQPERSSQSSLGTFRETFRVVWEPELSVRLVEASVHGNTVAVAAARCLIEKASETEDLATLTGLLDRALVAELPGALDVVLHRVQEQSARSGDVPRLCDALPPLARAARYGSVREVSPEPILAIIDGLFERIVIGLAGACALLDPEAARVMRARILGVHESVRLLERGTQRSEWNELLGALAARDGVHPAIRGTCMRMLVEEGLVSEVALGVAARRALSSAVPPVEAAAWLGGLVAGSAMLLLHRDELWAALDLWLSGLGSEAFAEQLPLVRRAFADFGSAERRAMGERVRRAAAQTLAHPGGSEDPSAAGRGGLDPARLALLSPILSTVLGVPIDATW